VIEKDKVDPEKTRIICQAEEKLEKGACA